MKKFLLIMLSALMLPIFSVNASGKKDDKKSVWCCTCAYHDAVSGS